jgi:hypothetical protein
MIGRWLCYLEGDDGERGLRGREAELENGDPGEAAAEDEEQIRQQRRRVPRRGRQRQGDVAGVARQCSDHSDSVTPLPPWVL